MYKIVYILYCYNFNICCYNCIGIWEFCVFSDECGVIQVVVFFFLVDEDIYRVVVYGDKSVFIFY